MKTYNNDEVLRHLDAVKLKLAAEFARTTSSPAQQGGVARAARRRGHAV
jgi:hypothetical protein